MLQLVCSIVPVPYKLKDNLVTSDSRIVSFEHCEFISHFPFDIKQNQLSNPNQTKKVNHKQKKTPTVQHHNVNTRNYQ